MDADSVLGLNAWRLLEWHPVVGSRWRAEHADWEVFTTNDFLTRPNPPEFDALDISGRQDELVTAVHLLTERPLQLFATPNGDEIEYTVSSGPIMSPPYATLQAALDAFTAWMNAMDGTPQGGNAREALRAAGIPFR